GNYKAEYEGQVTYFRIGIVTVEDANDYVQELPDDAFGARPDQTRMFYNRMFELADRLVDSGEERAADAILEHVILSTMDGSLTPDDPRDDRNDRITDPTAQAVLTGCISNLIGR
ncbi:MAG: hypothetical protein KAT70_02050, partial [Thermoplasmata archaeon]|nr:hypothetical protein [Thermoplasmata archaeon]